MRPKRNLCQWPQGKGYDFSKALIWPSSMNGNVVEQVNSAKVLGVLLDDHLTWDQHVDRLSKTLNSRLSLLRRISPFLDFHSSLLFYTSCIHSQLAYCSTVWGSCSKDSLLRLLRCQKRAARILLNADFSVPSVSLFSRLNWIPIIDFVKCRKLQLLFSTLLNPDSPSSLRRSFSFLSSVQTRYSTRGAVSCNLSLTKPRTNSGKRTFAYSVATLFNGLETHLNWSNLLLALYYLSRSTPFLLLSSANSAYFSRTSFHAYCI